LTACKGRPSRADQLRLGDEAIARKDYVKAARAYDAAARSGPADGPLWAKAADTALRAGRLRMATDAAVRAADLMPDRMDSQLLAARLMLELQRFGEVEERMTTLAATHPDNLSVLISLANAKGRLSSGVIALNGASGARTKDEFVALARKSRPGTTARELEGNTAKADAEAERILRQVVAANPNNPRPALALANFLWAAGRADEAEPILRRIADEHPEQGIANLALGVYYVLNHRRADAERYLKAASNDSSGAVLGPPSGLMIDAKFALADLYTQLHRDADAVAVLATIPPSHVTAASLRLARMEFGLGKREAAMQRVDTLLQRQQPPPPIEARLLKAQFLVAEHQTAEAVTIARQIVDTSTAPSLEARTTLAGALFAAGDLENAFDQYQEATRLDPLAADAFVHLAQAAIALGRSNNAVIAAREGARLQPEDRAAALTLARALVIAASFSEAEQVLKPWLAREPDAADLLVQKGIIDANRGADDAARASFAKVLKATPDSPDATGGLIDLDLKHQRTDAARSEAEATIRSHPQDARYLDLAVRVYKTVNDDARTKALQEQLLRVDPGNLDAALAVSSSLASRSPEDAKSVLEQLLKKRPRALEARYALGILLERLGHDDEARREYDAVLADPPRADSAAIRSKARARKSVL
jgi:tetratricopeptide (TPR) repeat protein